MEARLESEIKAMSPAEFAALGAPEVVYFREMTPAEAFGPDEIPADFVIGGNRKVVVVFGANGERLAIVTDRAAAGFAAARNGLFPVVVH